MNIKLKKILKETPIGRLLSTPPVALDVTDSIETAVQKMREEKFGCVLIVKGKKLAGVVTERDMVRSVIGQNISYQDSIEKIMHKGVATVTPEDPVAKVLKIMAENNYRHVPVVNQDGEVQGLVRTRDIIDYFAEHFPYEVFNQPPTEKISETSEGA